MQRGTILPKTSQAVSIFVKSVNTMRYHLNTTLKGLVFVIFQRFIPHVTTALHVTFVVNARNTLINVQFV